MPSSFFSPLLLYFYMLLTLKTMILVLSKSKPCVLFKSPQIKLVGEKSETEKAIIEALRSREVWQRRKPLHHPQPKSYERSSSSTPTTQIGLTKLSDTYGSDSAKNTDEWSQNYQNGSGSRTKH